MRVCIRIATIWKRPLKINKIQGGFVDICNNGAYLNGTMRICKAKQAAIPEHKRRSTNDF